MLENRTCALWRDFSESLICNFSAFISYDDALTKDWLQYHDVITYCSNEKKIRGVIHSYQSIIAIISNAPDSLTFKFISFTPNAGANVKLVLLYLIKNKNIARELQHIMLRLK